MSPRPPFGPKPYLGYTASQIERAAEIRPDAAALATLEHDPAARAYVIAGEMVVLNRAQGDADPLFPLGDASALGTARETIFIGLQQKAPRFAIALDPASVEPLKAREQFLVTDLRSIAVNALVHKDHLPPLAEPVSAGWRRDCPSCKTEHFPRTDPVVIMLPVAGSSCVLGRSYRFARSMWSCLAGFMEPGETIEEAVRRETREEAGIVCGRVNYFASQPWPFPSSLMIGCHAEALTREIVIDRSELDNARWFDREEVAAMLLRIHPEGVTTPPEVAIAYHIIRAWVEGEVALP